MDHIGLDHEIFKDKLGPINVIGMDAAHPGGSYNNGLDIFILKKPSHGSLIDKIQFVAGPGDDVLIMVGLQLTMDGRADHPPMAR
jgi:hypothetical protein